MPARIPSPNAPSEPVIVNGSESNARITVSTTSGRRYQANTRDENWPVKVTIHHINYSEMTLSGTMEAYNIPDKTSPTQDAHIVTFLEGEIIDFNQHTLETKNFKADADTDSTYWRELQPFKDLSDADIAKNLVSRTWITEKLTQGWILMRWKERCFITPTDSRQGLTISGFYYISLCRESGHIEGLYYDPGSSPYQQLSLKTGKCHADSSILFFPVGGAGVMPITVPSGLPALYSLLSVAFSFSGAKLSSGSDHPLDLMALNALYCGV